MLCTVCGADLGTRASKFCQQCGALLDAQVSTIRLTGRAARRQKREQKRTRSEPTLMSPVPEQGAASPWPEDMEPRLAEPARSPEPASPEPDQAALKSLRPEVSEPVQSPALEPGPVLTSPWPEDPEPSLPESVQSASPVPGLDRVAPASLEDPRTQFAVPEVRQEGSFGTPFAAPDIRPETAQPSSFSLSSALREPSTVDPFLVVLIGQNVGERQEPALGVTDAPATFAQKDRRTGTVAAITAFFLLMALLGLWWLNTGERSPPEANDEGEVAETVRLPEKSSPLVAPPVARLPSDSQSPEAEPVILGIPTLPSNQRGRHNSAENRDIGEQPLSSSPQPPPPLPSLSASSPLPSPSQASPLLSPLPLPLPQVSPKPRESTEDEPDPEEVDMRSQNRQDTGQLSQFRRELARCRGFFCREEVRKEYCTGDLRYLPECRSGSL